MTNGKGFFLQVESTVLPKPGYEQTDREGLLKDKSSAQYQNSQVSKLDE